MSLAHTLWQANQDLARASLEMPFVQGIGDGTLARARFAYYIGQDAFFLEAFARAYSVAAAKAPDWEAFHTLHTLAGGVFDELQMHTQFAATWDIDLRQVQPGPTTRRYTDFLLATAWSSDLSHTAAAMAPCARLYAFIGQELARTERPEHTYTNWVRTYSSPEVADLARQIEQLIDRSASDTPQVRECYRYAMLCERDFFQAAWEYVTA